MSTGTSKVVSWSSQQTDAAGASSPPVLPGGAATTANKQMLALNTVADGDLACPTGVADTPIVSANLASGYIGVTVNGIWYDPTDGGDPATRACYFSGDGGLTARALRDVQVGDRLYWNGSIALFQLANTDRISFYYNV